MILISYCIYTTYKLNYIDIINYYIVLLYIIIMFTVSIKVKSQFIHIVCVQLLLLELYISLCKVNLIP